MGKRDTVFAGRAYGDRVYSAVRDGIDNISAVPDAFPEYFEARFGESTIPRQSQRPAHEDITGPSALLQPEAIQVRALPGLPRLDTPAARRRGNVSQVQVVQSRISTEDLNNAQCFLFLPAIFWFCETRKAPGKAR